MSTATLTRRAFLLGSAAVAASFCLPSAAFAARRPQTLVLSLYNQNTGEKLNSVPFKEFGRYNADALHWITYVLRDFREKRMKPIDPMLLEYLYDVQTLVGFQGHITVLSGYRTKRTNEMLARRSDSVAHQSFHLDARAVDFALPGKSLTDVKKAALSLQRGGVGYYPQSGFIHIDTGRFRQW